MFHKFSYIFEHVTCSYCILLFYNNSITIADPCIIDCVPWITVAYPCIHVILENKAKQTPKTLYHKKNGLKLTLLLVKVVSCSN